MNPDEQKPKELKNEQAAKSEEIKTDQIKENQGKKKDSDQPSVMQIVPERKMEKHNKMLVAMMVVLFLVIAAFAGLMVYQLNNGAGEIKTDTTKTSSPATNSTTSTDLSQDDNQPVTTNVDTELNYLDDAMGAQTDEDFSDDNLSNSSLGIN